MTETGAIKAVLRPKEKNINGLNVRRALPFIQQRAIGPWVFFDHFGPVRFKPGQGIDVGVHPHINLATVTYLFDGEIFHRDSLGHAVPIYPGAINLMVAGRGIAHSETTREALRATGYTLHGLQLWHALPEEYEEIEPAFYHTSANDIPIVESDGAVLRVLMGKSFGHISPVKSFSSIIYIDADMEDGAYFDIPKADERGLYIVKGEAEVSSYSGRSGVATINTMTVLSRDAKTITAKGHTRLVIIGGAPLGYRHMWWNFISSRPERIEQAKQDWAEGRFGNVDG